MCGAMAVRAKDDQVVRVESELGVRGPRLDVVEVHPFGAVALLAA
jgi:hypothetical protein